jgi:hypothetical protein
VLRLVSRAEVVEDPRHHDGVADALVELVTSNDACLPFVAGFESGDLSEWSGAGD